MFQYNFQVMLYAYQCLKLQLPLNTLPFHQKSKCSFTPSLPHVVVVRIASYSLKIFLSQNYWVLWPTWSIWVNHSDIIIVLLSESSQDWCFPTLLVNGFFFLILLKFSEIKDKLCLGRHVQVRSELLWQNWLLMWLLLHRHG